MTDDEIRTILEEIMHLASEIGWVTVLSQDNDGNVYGMYVGENDWINKKTGNISPDGVKH
jgi:hypothetical protein